MTDQTPPSGDDLASVGNPGGTERPRSPWTKRILFGSVVAVTVLATALVIRELGPSTEAEDAESLDFAEVVITDLVQEEVFDGTLGSVDDDPVRTQLGGTITEIAAPGDTVRQGESLFSIDGEPVVLLYGDLPAFRDIAIGEESVAVSSQLLGTITSIAEPGTVIQQGGALYSVNGQPVIALYGDVPAFRDIAISEGSVTVSSQLFGAITSIAEPGTVIQQGDALYSVDGQSVIALYGDVPAFRDIAFGAESVTVSSQLFGTLTSIAEPGTIIQQGDVLYSVDGQPVIALYGDQPAYRSLHDTTSDLAAAQKAVSFAERDLEAAMAALEEVATPSTSSDLETAVVQAEQDYRGVLTRWLGAAPEGFETLTLDGILEMWDTTLAEIYTPPAEGGFVDDSSTPWNEAVIWAWTNLAPFHIDTEATSGLVPDETVEISPPPAVMAPRGEIGDAWSALENARDERDAQGVLDAATILAAEKTVSDAEDDVASAQSELDSLLAPLSGPDVLQLEIALAALDYDADGTLVADGIFTPETTEAVLAFQAALGLETNGVLDHGEVVFLPGPAQVLTHLAAPGDPAGGGVMRVATGDPTTGTDVLQLEEALVTLGYNADGALVADGTYTPETTQAVLAFQAAVGLERDGVLDHGEITFLPGPAQVLVQLAAPGDSAGGGVISVAAGNPTTGADVLQLEEALIALGYNAEGDLVADGIFTPETTRAVLAFQAAAGLEQDGIIGQGEIVFLPGPAQVLAQLAATGDSAGGGVVRVATGEPTTGPDVLQLEGALVALGYDADGTLVADGTYTPETTRAVLDFQAATGLENDGIVDQGEVVFLSGAVRITDQLATEGSGVGPGSAVLGISLTPKVVRVDLPADQQGLLAAGNTVTVELPDFTEVTANVLSVSQTAQPAEFGPATFDVLVELDDPASAAGLDEAPVDVSVVSDSVEDVMAVPVSALVALLEGGYAVEIDAGGGLTQLVAVEVGFFGVNGMIEINSASLRPGDRVLVP